MVLTLELEKLYSGFFRETLSNFLAVYMKNSFFMQITFQEQQKFRAIGVYQLLMHIMVILGKQKKMVLKLLNSALLVQKYPIF